MLLYLTTLLRLLSLHPVETVLVSLAVGAVLCYAFLAALIMDAFTRR